LKDEEFDPWKTSIQGIKVMSPEEDATWRRFEDAMTAAHGWGWSVELDLSPTPAQRRAEERMHRVGAAIAARLTDAAIEAFK
jgi:hypothetical protein